MTACFDGTPKSTVATQSRPVRVQARASKQAIPIASQKKLTERSEVAKVEGFLLLDYLFHSPGTHEDKQAYLATRIWRVGQTANAKTAHARKHACNLPYAIFPTATCKKLDSSKTKTRPNACVQNNTRRYRCPTLPRHQASHQQAKPI